MICTSHDYNLSIASLPSQLCTAACINTVKFLRFMSVQGYVSLIHICNYYLYSDVMVAIRYVLISSNKCASYSCKLHLILDIWLCKKALPTVLSHITSSGHANIKS